MWKFQQLQEDRMLEVFWTKAPILRVYYDQSDRKRLDFGCPTTLFVRPNCGVHALNHSHPKKHMYGIGPPPNIKMMSQLKHKRTYIYNYIYMTDTCATHNFESFLPSTSSTTMDSAPVLWTSPCNSKTMLIRITTPAPAKKDSKAPSLKRGLSPPGLMVFFCRWIGTYVHLQRLTIGRVESSIQNGTNVESLHTYIYLIYIPHSYNKNISEFPSHQLTIWVTQPQKKAKKRTRYFQKRS